MVFCVQARLHNCLTRFQKFGLCQCRTSILLKCIWVSMENMLGDLGFELCFVCTTKPPSFSRSCWQLTAGREQGALLWGRKINEILRLWQEESRGNFRQEEENNKAVSKQRGYKTRAKKYKIWATIAEKDEDISYVRIRRPRTQSNLLVVSGCTEGYSISELCCCLFSVLTFLRDNPLLVLQRSTHSQSLTFQSVSVRWVDKGHSGLRTRPDRLLKTSAHSFYI